MVLDEESRVNTAAGDEAPPDAREHFRSEVREEIEALRRSVGEELAAKNRQIDRLHEEVQEHRHDLLRRTVEPLLFGVLRLHDDLGRTLEGLRRRDDLELTPERFFTAFEQFREELELILGQHGVAPFRNPADAFDPGRQRAVSTVPTDDPARVGWIAGRRRPGFERGGEVLCKERVVVYALSRKRDATAQGADGSCGEPAATPNGGAA